MIFLWHEKTALKVWNKDSKLFITLITFSEPKLSFKRIKVSTKFMLMLYIYPKQSICFGIIIQFCVRLHRLITVFEHYLIDCLKRYIADMALWILVHISCFKTGREGFCASKWGVRRTTFGFSRQITFFLLHFIHHVKYVDHSMKLTGAG